ncbi:MAG: insulinase family protein [Caloramator sp.]|jgi:predicted Zn-dependent peptidase|uniref:M16 family metallopeptidase n=1 Tax=Caloramator sp. TaxID=1871330 RepID=UPI001D3A90EE|nr:pitrilysin family protein [Caloramator sp.]MBZ4663499.1 insulinase family protein [Caloramator sp.]
MYQVLNLNNGIRVVLEHIPYVNSVSVGVWVKSGSRYESKEINGISHFIEHMMFKGTQNRTAKQIAEDIEGLGGQINAFTSKEATCYYVKMIDQHIDIAIDVLMDMLLNANMNKYDIEKEKGVIKEEINMYEDSPEDLVGDLLSKATWDGDSLSYTILGTHYTIDNMSKEKILSYMRRTYNYKNIVIAIAGNFEKDKVIEKLESYFNKNHSDELQDLSISSPKVNNSILVKQKDIEQVHIGLSLDGIELGNEEIYTLSAINNYFGGGTSSRLFQRLREENGLVYTIYSFPSSYINCGSFNIYFALNENHVERAISYIKEEINNLCRLGIDKEQILKAKEQLKGNYILGLESVANRMFSMGKSLLLQNKVYEPSEVLSKIDKITEEDIRRIIDKIFSNGIKSAAIVGKNVEEEKYKKLIWG